MATATKDPPKQSQPAERDYRVTLRHSPFRAKSRVVEAANADLAWPAFLDILSDEHAKLTEPQKKVVGRIQQEWLAANLQRPADVEVITEEAFQARQQANQLKESENRRQALENKKAVQDLTVGQKDLVGQMSELIKSFPAAVAQGVVAALKEQAQGQPKAKG